MKGCVEFDAVKKDKALGQVISTAIASVQTTYPEEAKKPFFIQPSRKWEELPDTLYWIREHEGSERSLFAITTDPVSLPLADLIEVFLIGESSSGKSEDDVDVYIVPTMQNLI